MDFCCGSCCWFNSMFLLKVPACKWGTFFVHASLVFQNKHAVLSNWETEKFSSSLSFIFHHILFKTGKLHWWIFRLLMMKELRDTGLVVKNKFFRMKSDSGQAPTSAWGSIRGRSWTAPKIQCGVLILDTIYTASDDNIGKVTPESWFSSD